MKAETRDAYELFHMGARALAECEAVGMRIDVPRLKATIGEVAGKIREMDADLRRDEFWNAWRRRYGSSANMGSRMQLATVLYAFLGHGPKERSDVSGRAKMDEDTLTGLSAEVPFLATYLRLEKYKKLRSTYLEGILRETDSDGFLHPSFNLHLVKSHRSSSDTPNFQNIPTRDKELGGYVRRCFIPRPGHVLVMRDYGAQEFKVAACFWRDDAMVRYASDPSLDIHRDMAAECYRLPADAVPSMCRFFAKNQFVFPQLYGSWWKACARNLWSAIDKAGLKTVDGIGLKEHLADCGISGFAEYERHVEEVEDRFHGRFPTWAERKERWWARYEKKGWFRLLTGFVCSGVYTRNQAYNIPIQGPAFHCLLWSLIRVVGWVKKSRMRSVVPGQIHDELFGDVHRDELDDYVAKTTEVMEEKVREAWPWIVVPLSAELAVAEETWFDKKVVEVGTDG